MAASMNNNVNNLNVYDTGCLMFGKAWKREKKGDPLATSLKASFLFHFYNVYSCAQKRTCNEVQKNSEMLVRLLGRPDA